MKCPFKQLVNNHVRKAYFRDRNHANILERGPVPNDWKTLNYYHKPLPGGDPYDLSVDWAKEQLARQDGRSYWLGVPVDMMKIFEPYNPLSPSVDRLDNNVGHIPENCVIALRFENLGFGRCSHEQRQELIRVFQDWFQVEVPDVSAFEAPAPPTFDETFV